MSRIIIPKREEILRLLNGVRKIPFSPNYISTDAGLEIIMKREGFNPQRNYVPSPDNIVLNTGLQMTLIQRIPLRLAFIDQDIFKDYFASGASIRGSQKHVGDLYESGFLEYESKIPLDKMKTVNDRFPKTPFFHALYLFPTDVCNLDCSYCNVEQNMLTDHKKSFMRIETAKEAIDLFIRQLKSTDSLLKTAKPKYIAFYGGEALLNKEVLNWSIQYANTALSKEGLAGKVNLCVMTNGTLIDDEEARFLGEHNVKITVSFDGLQRHHDSMRAFHSGRGSFTRTLIGYDKIRKKCDVTILSTVGNHNVNDLEEISHYFATELEPTAVEFSLVRNLKFGTSPASIQSLDDAFGKLYAAHKILIDKHIPDNNFSRRILAMANQYIYSHHLTRCGDVLYISPRGGVYACDSFLGADIGTGLSTSSAIEHIQNNGQIKEWFARHPFNMPACEDCASISLCGGGCPYNAQVTKGSIYEADEQICRANNYILDKLIKELQHTCR